MKELIGRKPLFQQIADDLKKQLKENNEKGDNYLSTVTELSKSYGVNRITMRKALRFLEEQEIISPLRNKKRKILGPTTKSNMVKYAAFFSYGLHKSRFSNPIHLKIYEALTYELQRFNINSLKIMAEDDFLRFANILESEQLAGFITIGLIDAELKSRLKRYGKPVLLINPIVSTNDTNENIIDIDGEIIGHESVKYLVKAGCKNIGLLHHEYSVSHPINDRIRMGYERALKNTLPNCKPSIYEFFSGMPSPTREKMFDKVVRDSNKMDALICQGTDDCLQLMFRLNKENINIPERFSILTLEGIVSPNQFNPPLTCFCLDSREYAKFATKHIMNLIRGNIDSLGKILYNPYRLVEGQSVKKSS